MELRDRDKEVEGEQVSPLGGACVVDASVVVKWFVDEEHSEQARRLEEDYVEGKIDILAPTLLDYEVLNALRYSGAFGEEELKEVARVLEDLQLGYVPVRGNLMGLAVELALKKGITIYDASYVALAVDRGIVLWTADEKLVRKVKMKEVRHVSSYRGKA